MTGFMGMDPRTVRAVAGGLNAQSGAVGSIISHLDHALSRSGGHWYGDDADQFVHLWTSTFRPQLQSLARELDHMSRAATANADEQDRTSGQAGTHATGGAGGTRGGDDGEVTPDNATVRGKWEGLLNEYGSTLGLAAWPTTVVGVANLMTPHKYSMGAYTKRAQELFKHGSWFEYKKSPAFQFAHRHAQGIGWLDNKLSVASRAVAGAQVLGKAGEVWNYAANGGTWQDMVGSGLEGGASALGFVKATPATMLGAVALNGWGQVAHDAAKVDWSPEAKAQTAAYAANNPLVVAEEVGKATVQVLGHDIWKWTGLV